MCLYITYYVWWIYNDKFKPQKIKNQSSYAKSTKNNVIKGSLVSNYNIFNLIHKLHITISTSPYFIKPWASSVYKTIIIKNFADRIQIENCRWQLSIQTFITNLYDLTTKRTKHKIWRKRTKIIFRVKIFFQFQI